MKKQRVIIIIGLVLVLLTSIQVGSWLGYQRLEQNARNELFRYQASLEELLDRFSLIPPVLAANQLFVDALNYGAEDQVYRANVLLQGFADRMHASDIYIMDTLGITRMTSNWNLDNSFLYRDFNFRPYFQQAMQGRAAIYSALGTTSGVRGLYFSYPIIYQNSVIGVLALKLNIPDLETAWQSPYSEDVAELMVTDEHGIVFLSTREDWRYRSTEPLNHETILQLQQEQRYGEYRFEPLQFSRLPSRFGMSPDTWQVIWHNGSSINQYLAISGMAPMVNWEMTVLVPSKRIWLQQLRTLATLLSIYIAIVVLWLFQQERSHRLQNLVMHQRELEQRVLSRTEDLEQSNLQLMREVDERHRAEQELKTMQEELIQAAKLATLGQMSASINHELNQPLTAITAFTQNSQKFLQRGKTEAVENNLKEILALCQRMHTLISQFKIFARKSPHKLVMVELQNVIHNAVHLVQSGLENNNIQFYFSLPETHAFILGDMIRLEQVVVNLLSNAVQACQHNSHIRIKIALQQLEDEYRISVIDNGPGLDQEPEQVFEPFYTTKSVTEGLGLGLSISRQIITTMNGRLQAEYSDDPEFPGALFRIYLPVYHVADHENTV
ncbi:sensor histidine kinase [Gynuella sunshinyii]|uniref:C4-dicarboxylate transport sensor protein DctB n=1 Tax=Gynuella sunshinyii YC6258 TaxID=1445510 RepID=A0A0C5VQA7_9GAMM|nr:ATP-binding protein [Gynuella sunshinyii]AJQ92469.1 signal transduction histidine kinase regulating C4-dicarboxylate transport system [Gynuella sunshinyii YC6258]